MAANTRLSVASHILLALGHLAARGEGRGAGGGPQTSETLARSVKTHPVVLRRILGRLARAGLVHAHPGPTGGYELSRALDRISLLDVWRALDDQVVFGLPETPVNRACVVSCGVRDALGTAFERVDRAVETSLGKTTLAALLSEIEKR